MSSTSRRDVTNLMTGGPVSRDDHGTMDIIWIDTEDLLRSLLKEIRGVSAVQPSFYIDAEGFGRAGSPDLLQIHVLPLQKTFIIDVFTLQRAAFDTTFRTTLLRTLLESPCITKVLFDLRQDSNAMYSNYQVSIESIVDLQLMEYFKPGRCANPQYLNGLKVCVQRDSGFPPECIKQWSQEKTLANSTARAFQKRPLPAHLLQYAAGDVQCMPSLYQVYRQQLTIEGWWSVTVRSQERIHDSRHPMYDPTGRQTAEGPSRMDISGSLESKLRTFRSGDLEASIARQDTGNTEKDIFAQDLGFILVDEVKTSLHGAGSKKPDSGHASLQNVPLTNGVQAAATQAKQECTQHNDGNHTIAAVEERPTQDALTKRQEARKRTKAARRERRMRTERAIAAGEEIPTQTSRKTKKAARRERRRVREELAEKTRTKKRAHEELTQMTRKMVEIVVEIPHDSRITAGERMMDAVGLQPAPRGHSLADILPEGSKRRRMAVIKM